MTTAVKASSPARDALDRSVERLLALQHPDGYWKGELETNVTIDSEDLFLRHFLRISDPRQTAATARWIRSKQREDGSWATFHGGPADVSTTVEAYVALRLAGDAADDPHMRRAAACVRSLGGIEATRVFTRMWLSLLGLWNWATVPVLPPEQMFLPARAPLSIYAFGCWARQTLVALQVATALRPVAAGSVPGRRAADRRRRSPAAARPGPARLRPARLRPAAPARPREGRALDRRTAGGGRVLGRHPAAVGVVADRPPGPTAFRSTIPCSPAAWPGWTPSRSRTSTGGGSRPVSRRSGTPPSR